MYTSVPLMHLKFMYICGCLFSNDFEKTNLESLKLILMSYQLCLVASGLHPKLLPLRPFFGYYNI